MKDKLILPAAAVLLGLLPPAALGQTTGAVPLATPHYGMSEGTAAPMGSTSVVPFNPSAATGVPAPQALPSVGAPGFGGVPGIVGRRH